MVDTLTPAERSERMSRIRGKNTKPEMIIRKLLHAAGYRYRLHMRDLPGKPDIVLSKYKTAIFVHGCFWHGHGCHIGHIPKSNSTFWIDKIKRNLVRDKIRVEALQRAGWRVLVIWECAITQKLRLSPEALLAAMNVFLLSGTKDDSIYGKQVNPRDCI